MSQGYILNNFKSFLDIQLRENRTELERDKRKFPEKKDRIDKIIQENQEATDEFKLLLNKGYCFGLTLSHGAMAISGKLNWWEHALVALNNWDGAEGSLDSVITIPDEDKSGTLRDLFNKALPYISASQTYVPEEFKTDDLNQREMLQPGGFFEMLGKDGAIQRIKKFNCIAGHFTEDDLKILLSEKAIQDSIFLVGINTDTGGHSIRIGYDGKNWILYDPNFSHKEVKSMHVLGSKNEIIKELFSLLKRYSAHPTINLKIASLDETKNLDFPHFEKLLKEKPALVLTGESIQDMAQVNSSYLASLFNHAKKSVDIRTALLSALKEITIPENWFGIYAVAQFTPHLLPHLFEVITGSPPPYNENWFQIISQKDPDLLTAVLAMALKKPESFKNFVSAATGSDVNNQAPSLLVAKALAEKTGNGETVLHYLAQQVPNGSFHLRFLFKSLARHSNEGGKETLLLLLKTLATPDSKGETGWQTVHNTSSWDDKKVIRQAIVEQLEKLTTKELVEVGGIISDALTNDQSALHGICKERYSFFGKEQYGKTSLWQELIDKTQSLLKQKPDIDKRQQEVSDLLNINSSRYF